MCLYRVTNGITSSGEHIYTETLNTKAIAAFVNLVIDIRISAACFEAPVARDGYVVCLHSLAVEYDTGTGTGTGTGEYGDKVVLFELPLTDDATPNILTPQYMTHSSTSGEAFRFVKFISSYYDSYAAKVWFAGSCVEFTVNVTDFYGSTQYPEYGVSKNADTGGTDPNYFVHVYDSQVFYSRNSAGEFSVTPIFDNGYPSFHSQNCSPSSIPISPTSFARTFAPWTTPLSEEHTFLLSLSDPTGTWGIVGDVSFLRILDLEQCYNDPTDTTNCYITPNFLSDDLLSQQTYISATFDVDNGYLFLGTESGLAIEVAVPSFELVSMNFVKNAISAIYTAPFALVTFWYVRGLGIYSSPYSPFAISLLYPLNNSGIAFEVYPTIPTYEYHSEANNVVFFADLDIPNISSIDQSYVNCTACFAYPMITKIRLSTCEQFTSCSSCLTGDPSFCGWSHQYQSCYYKKDSETSTWNNSYPDCPSILGISPSSGPTTFLQTVAITGSETDMSTSISATITCRWENIKTSAITSTNASVSYSTITCLTPNLGHQSGDYYVSVYYNSIPVDGNLTFNFYDCTSFSTCSSCLNRHPNCAWCSLNNSCSTEKECPISGESTSSICPKINSISPLSARASEGALINIVTTFVSSASVTYYCNWGRFGPTPVTYQSSTTFQCYSPIVSISSEQEEVLLNLSWTKGSATGSYLSYSSPFTFKGCTSITSCSECMSSSACYWNFDPTESGYQCVNNLNNSTRASCPSITALSPPSYDFSVTQLSSVNVALSSSWGLPIAQYICRFSYTIYGSPASGSTTGTVISSGVSCPLPVSLQSITSEVTVQIKIDVYNSTWPTTTLNFAADPYSWEVFSCTSDGSLITDATTCLALPGIHVKNCYWCLSTRSCLSQYSCPAADRSRKVPSIISITRPDSGQYFLVTPANVTVTATALTPSNEYHLSLGNSSLFAYQTSNCTVTSSTTAVCPFDALPSVSASLKYRQTLSLTLTELAPVDVVWQAYSAQILTGELVDCGQDGIADCTTCVTYRPNLCTWHMPSMSCVFSTSVTTSDTIGKQRTCPYITNLDPSSGSTKGNTEISLSAYLLVDASDYQVQIGTETADATFVSESLLSFELPPLPASQTPGVFNVSVWRLSKSYMSNSYSFEYEESSSGANLALIIPLAVGIPVVVLIILGVIIGTLIVKTRRRGVSLYIWNPTPPADLANFAYDGDWSSIPKQYSVDSWATFRKALMDVQVAQAICEITQATEADKVANSLVYIHASAHAALPLVSGFVQEEVKKVQSETLLFRANSMASKMFRCYSKMVGLLYLWKTLGQFLGEMHFLAQKEDKAQERNKKKGKDADIEMDGEKSSSMLTNDIEIDPNMMKAGMDEDAQSYLLAQRCRKLLVSIFASQKDLPVTLRYLVKCVRDQVTSRFEGENVAHIAIGGVIFLRFVWRYLLFSLMNYRFALPLPFRMFMAFLKILLHQGCKDSLFSSAKLYKISPTEVSHGNNYSN